MLFRSCQTQGIVDDIVRRGFDENKIHLLTNGVDTKLFKKENRDDNFRHEIGIENKFALCYAGIHGIAQGLEVIINAAEIVKDEENIQFIFVGDGPEKQDLINLAKEKGLNNVTFLPLQPKTNMPKIVASMDAAIIPLRKLELFKGALPSKMFETLASEIPIILPVQGEAAKLINSANAGIVVEPENSKEIAEAVLKLYNDIELRNDLGKNGRNYVMENYARENITRKLEKVLVNL